MKLRVPYDESEGIDMTPLIDIIFQLIIFFMIASSFVDEAKAYKVAIPQAQSPSTVSLDDAMVIRITADGIVAPRDATSESQAYESLMILVADLKQYRDHAVAEGNIPVVGIEADKDARYERIMQVWNAVKNAGISDVSFIVKPGSGDE